MTDKQIVGNTGLFYVCYRLSRLGWSVLPTSRNAKGIDAVIYSRDSKRRYLLQIKSLSGKEAVSIGKDTTSLHLADYLVVCRHVDRDAPELFVIKVDDTTDRILTHNTQYWIWEKDYKNYRDDELKTIGSG
ncbi:MAG: hypothetical protein JRN10_08415 [Nitrososphaerota archaeon]|jgi:hypothetical protein|nr:hypothetical protein [Nitrososphaerota archaeon]MDG6931241.1 hypothetical protein [Nitrososphaerota archaeon]